MPRGHIQLPKQGHCPNELGVAMNIGEVKLTDYLNMIWKRRRLIGMSLLVRMAAAPAIGLLGKPTLLKHLN
jgi:uncharacterized protein involved in exopolysaccharide biosynthesis